MSKKQKVVVSLKDLILPIQFYPKSEGMLPLPAEEMKRLARLAIEEHFNKEPLETLKISKADILNKPYLYENEVYPGRIVRTSGNELGIILNVSNSTSYLHEEKEKAVSVVLAGHRIQYFDHYELYETDASFAEARCLRMDFSRAESLWHQGDTAYMNYKEDGKTISSTPVIVGKTSRNVTKVHEISNNHKAGRTWEIKTILLYRYLTEFKNEAERESYLSTDSIIECYRIIKELSKPIKLNHKEQIILFQHLIFNNQSMFLKAADKSVEYKFYNSTILKTAYKKVINKIPPDVYEMVINTIKGMVRTVPTDEYIELAN